MIRLKPGFPVSLSELFRIFKILPTIIRSIVNGTEAETLPTVLKDSSNRQGFFQLSKKILPTIKDSSNRARATPIFIYLFFIYAWMEFHRHAQFYITTPHRVVRIMHYSPTLRHIPASVVCTRTLSEGVHRTDP